MVSEPPKPCWACRKGRLVCDCTKPACRKCEARGSECPGYDSKPLVWIPNGTVKSKRRNNNGNKDRQPDQEQVADAQPRKELVAKSPDRLWRKRPQLSFGLSELAVQIIDYYNQRICPDVAAASGVVDASNPYFVPLQLAPHLSFNMLYTMSCIVLGHRVLQLEQGEYRSDLSIRLQEHRGTAIGYISEAIATKNKQFKDETLWSVLAFLLSEVSGPQMALWYPLGSISANAFRDPERTRAVNPGWRLHMDGAASIIELRGGFPKLVVSSPQMRPMLVFYVVLDVMSAATSPPLSAEKARHQMEYTSVLDLLYGDGLATTVPCPPELFAAVIRVNHLRSVLHGTDVLTETWAPSVQSVLDDIIAFSPDVWAARVTTSHKGNVASRVDDLDVASSGGSSTRHPAKTHSQEFLHWCRIANAFRSSVGLYCINSLVGAGAHKTTGRTVDGVNTRELEQKFQTNLFQNLKEMVVVPETSSQRMKKLILWPSIIAGTQLGGEHEHMKTIVKEELEWLSLTLGSSSPLVGIYLLERIWNGSMGVTGHGRRPGWDVMFDRPYSFVI